MKCSIILASLLVVSGSRAASTSHIEGEVVERLHGIPEGWTEVGAPHPDQKLRFRIAVRSANPELLERTLMEVSSPSHPRYGQHLKRHELKDLVKPREDSTSNIIRWLEQSGVESRDIHNNGEWINFYVPVKRAEQMMETTFKTYQSGSRTDIKRIRSLGYSVPKHVRDDIDIIQPTTRFGEIHSQHSQISSKKVVPLSKLAVNATCNDMITPGCLAELYNFKNYRPNSANVTIGVTGFLEQYAQFADWSKFVSLFAPKAAGTTFGVTRVNNGPFIQNASDPNYEANLDVQYTAGLVAPAIKTQFYSIPGRGELVPDLDAPAQSGNYNEPYLDFFTYIADLEDDELPDVLATSYGENEQSVPPVYAKKVCDLIGQIGTRGVSVIFASGDSGPGSACQSNDGKNTTRFLPIFPAACPYVTSVGGTTGISPEAAVGLSSGGFSDLWPRPAYQDKAVSAYLEKLGDRWKGFYNPQGRGFPDVAAQAQDFMIFDRGQMESIGGTSAASPVFASVIALLNNARKGAGMPSLGFLNPWIYEQGYKGLNDIVEGGSRGCTGRSKYSKLIATWVPYAGWNATEGWDPVTGHGTPDFEELLKLAMILKSERRIRRGGLGS